MENQSTSELNQNLLQKLLTKKVFLTLAGAIILAEVLWAGWSLFKSGSQSSLSPSPLQPKSTTVALQAQKEKVKVGETVTVFIQLTSDKETDGTDLIINFDPKLLSLEGQDKSPVVVGGLYNDYPLNKAEAGKITVSGLASEKGVLADGLFGKVTFKAVSAGRAEVKLEFVKGATTDTNVIEKGSGEDVLEDVKNVTITILE